MTSTLSVAVSCGLMGAVHVHYLRFVSPFVFTFFLSTDLMVYVMVGGLGSFWGVVISALLVGVVRGITIHFVPAAGEASIYVLMFLVLLFRPRGLLGERIEKFE